MMKAFRIGLMVDTSRAYGRSVCEGVAEFVAKREDWLVHIRENIEPEEISSWLKHYDIHAVIAYVTSAAAGKALAKSGLPVVDVHGRGLCPSGQVYNTDPRLIAEMAADYFAKAGFTRFAYCGYPGVFFSDQRETAFVERATAAGVPVSKFSPRHDAEETGGEKAYERGRFSHEKEIGEWVRKLPKPVAILVANDIRGQQVINAARAVEAHLPGEIVVMGVDNDELLCGLCRPTLSSIAQNTRQIGLFAATEIDRRLNGGAAPKTDDSRFVLVPPLRIVERQSTDTVLSDQPVVQKMLRMINADLAGISPKQLSRELGLSRITLDKLMRNHQGCTVSEWILRLKIDRSKRLLAEETEGPAHAIGSRCGFTSATYFCRAFKRETGMTPIAFRERAQAGRIH
jgi:LacI family transcriptional regulator